MPQPLDPMEKFPIDLTDDHAENAQRLKNAIHYLVTKWNQHVADIRDEFGLTKTELAAHADLMSKHAQHAQNAINELQPWATGVGQSISTLHDRTVALAARMAELPQPVEHAALLDENRALKARIAELESQLVREPDSELATGQETPHKAPKAEP